MSKSIHTTFADVKDLSRTEIDQQSLDSESDLSKLAEKSHLKKEKKASRKNAKVKNDLEKRNGL